MAIVPRKLKNEKIVYWVVNKWNGEPVWERIGTERRAAERRDPAMKKEIAAGTYLSKKTGAATVQSYANGFFAKRKARSAENEESLFKNHVVKRCPWYAKLRVEDVRPRHTLQLVEELRKPYDGRYGPGFKMSEKSISLIVGVLSAIFRDARFHEITTVDPCELPFGTLTRHSPPRSPYSAAEMAALTTDPRIEFDVRMMNAIGFYTGQRIGEVCGRRWSDLDRGSIPLQCLSIETQYDDQELKTSGPTKRRTRKAPVHPQLEALLDEWHRKGWELYYLRKPTEHDFIVPRRDIPGAKACLTRSMAYKRFVAACETIEIKAHTVHAMRNTFITLTRRAGCNVAALEKITHNATGSMIDQYTEWDWKPLCDVVMSLPIVRLPPPPQPVSPRPAKKAKVFT